jgi:hypothetical protein
MRSSTENARAQASLLAQTHNYIPTIHKPLTAPRGLASSFGLSNSTSLPFSNTTIRSKPSTTVSSLCTAAKIVCLTNSSQIIRCISASVWASKIKVASSRTSTEELSLPRRVRAKAEELFLAMRERNLGNGGREGVGATVGEKVWPETDDGLGVDDFEVGQLG